MENNTMIKMEEYREEKKRAWIAVMLTFPFGHLGLQWFYMGHKWRGIAFIIASIITNLIDPGLCGLWVLCVWISAFFMPAEVKKHNSELRKNLGL